MIGDSETAERRRAPRVSFVGERVVAHVEGRTVLCRGGNLSEGGMLVYPERPGGFAGKRAALLSFRLPRARGRLHVEGRIRRVELVGGQIAWGISFRRIRPTVARMLRTFVFAGHGEVKEYV